MENLKPIAVVNGARTPLAKAFTDLRTVTAVQLGCHAVQNALKKCGLEPGDISEVVMGSVSGQADAANLARVISLESGVPMDRIAHTVNRNCASGMESIVNGWQAIAQDRASLVIAGGTESMSGIPMIYRAETAAKFMKLSRSKTMMQRLKVLASFRPKHFKPIVGLELGLTDPTCGLNMGQTAEILAKEFSISREEQDAFALHSHEKALAAQEKCFLSGEVAALEVNGVAIAKDNGPRMGQSMAQLQKLRTIFDRQGTVTAGNSCPITDGAAALVLAPVDQLSRFASPPLGYITAYSIAGCDPRRMGLGPVFATAQLMRQTGLKLTDFDLIEINEAFAAQVIACQKAAVSDDFARRELGLAGALGEISPEKLNVHGGAIALGHPVGTTGTRLVLTLLRALKATGGRRGLATLCVGGGQGVAMVVETELES